MSSSAGLTVGRSRGPAGDLSLRELMTPFARAILAKAGALREYLNDLSHSQQRRFLESIGDDIKKATALHPHDMSVAAAEEAARRGVDLTAKTWHDQPRFDPGRKTFIAEHMVPVSALVYACTQQSDIEGVLNVLVNRLRVVWLLRDEDKSLTRLGFRHRRASPEQAYQAAGIRIAIRADR